jgi:hypothetical protein
VGIDMPQDKYKGLHGDMDHVEPKKRALQIGLLRDDETKWEPFKNMLDRHDKLVHEVTILKKLTGLGIVKYLREAWNMREAQTTSNLNI